MFSPSWLKQDATAAELAKVRYEVMYNPFLKHLIWGRFIPPVKMVILGIVYGIGFTTLVV